MWEWFERYWSSVGLGAALVLLIFLFCTNMFRNAGSPSRWRDPVWLAWLMTVAYLLHNFEEYVGARPAARLAGWLAIVATFGLTILGPTFKLPEWALSISPLHHVPNISGPAPHWTGLVIVAAVGIGLLTIAFTGFWYRDIA